MWNSKYAVPWSDHYYGHRDRTSHPQRTKQRAQEEEVSWTWEEILAGQDRLPWRESPKSMRGQQRRRGGRPQKPQEIVFWGAHGAVDGAEE